MYILGRLGRERYEFDFKGKFPFISNKVKLKNHSYTFRDHNNNVYNCSVHEYPIDSKLSVFAIKFRRKLDRRSKCKGYQKTFKNSYADAMRIISTNMEIFHKVVSENENHIFGFHGVWDTKDVKRKKRSKISRRHSIWWKCSYLYFPDDYFDYSGKSSNNLLFFKRKSVHIENWEDKVRDILIDAHDDYEEISTIPVIEAQYN